jgi:predicted ribonuclease YlaK
MTNNFYDTNALLKRAGDLFEKEENIIISSITLTELESIKTSAHKDIDIKYSARKLTHLLADNPDKYQVWIFKEKMLDPIIAMGLEVNNDTKILACAIDCDKHAYLDRVDFYTNDLSLKNMAKLFFDKDCIKSINPEAEDNYKGYKEIYVDDAGLAELYDGSTVPDYLKVNEYLILKDINDEHIIDKLRWDG